MISRSRLWSNFLHWRTNQLLSFHKFPQKIIASCCSNSYPQGWRTVTVLLSATFDFTPKAATQSAYKPSMSAISSWGRTTQTQTQTETQVPWWVSSAALPFQGVVHLTVQVFRTSTARAAANGKNFVGGGEYNLPQWNLLVTDAQDDSFVTSSFLRHAVRARAFKIVQIFSVNRDEHF